MFSNDAPVRKTLELRSPSVPRFPRPDDAGTRKPLQSGFYTAVDEYAGLDRLDREELDEQDHDLS